MTSRAVVLAAKIQKVLQDMGYEVSRHASSMLIMYDGLLAATLHVYPDTCVLNIYTPWSTRIRGAQEEILATLEKHCPGVEARQAPLGATVL